MSLPPDILHKISQKYSDDQQAEVQLKLLDLKRFLESHSWVEIDRVLRGVIHLNSNLDKMDIFINLTRQDPRDLLLNAEYKLENGKDIQLHDFSKPFTD
ncbi:MAG: hypothetical protein R3C11_13690 [Planctomycetaceae bacterium]